MYRVEVPKAVRLSWLLVLENTLGKLGRSRDWSLAWGAGVKANLKGIPAIIRPLCEISQKMLGVFLILRLEYV